jgi:hypothetical protein
VSVECRALLGCVSTASSRHLTQNSWRDEPVHTSFGYLYSVALAGTVYRRPASDVGKDRAGSGRG